MRRYTRSLEYLSRAEEIIPGGNQTFSKSRWSYPHGVSPCFVTHGSGAHVWDLDGNEYVDLVNGLATITLGYNDPDVTRAVEKQLQSGVIFSLPHTIELEVAEMLVELVPCAEMVRFGKNGSDVTAGAIRVARAYTGRDHVAVCGYHGWQDWYIGSTARNLGVPNAVRELTHAFAYNDMSSLRAVLGQHPGGFAAVILEPMSAMAPDPGYLAAVKQLVHDNGAVLIFDEMVTGFRLAVGGAQQFFGVTPDLATFGKGLANGYPLSALAGSAKIMRTVEDIFFSLTYGGETLSLAAALATLRKISSEPVLEKMAELGTQLKEGVERRIERYGLSHLVTISGHPSWTFVRFKGAGGYSEWEVRTLFQQEMLARGILTFGMQAISWAHDESDIRRVLSAYDEVLPILKDATENDALHKHLRCEPLVPLFKVR